MILNKQANKYKFLNKAFILTSVAICLCVALFPPANALSYDVFGYYLYLPLTFKYDDLRIHNYATIDYLLKTYGSSDSFYQAYKLENGDWVMKYSMGMSVMYAPFYFIGDILAKVLGFAADGFSKPYQFSIVYGCVLYTILGLNYFRKVLRHFFADNYAALVFLVIVLGTNYLFHVGLHGQGAMTHNILFSLFAFLIWQTIQWHQYFKLHQAFLIGLSIGLMALIRPPEIISCLVPLLYGVSSITTAREKCKIIFGTYALHFLLILGVIALAVGCQLVYLKMLTGNPFFNTYEAINPGEGFEFTHPYVLEVLFSFRKGWFIYTPIMLFAVAGFWQLFRSGKVFFLAALIYFLLHLFIVSSWSCWWYAGSYSSRALISSYAVLAVPLGFFLTKVMAGKFRWLFGAVFSLLVALNLFQSWQVKEGIINSTNMSADYYRSVFLQTDPISDEQRKLLLIDKFARDGEDFTKEDSLTHMRGFVAWDNFEKNEKKENYTIDTLMHSGKQCLVTGSPYEFSPSIKAPMESITKKSYTWIRASIWFYTDYNPDSLDAMLLITVSHNDVNYRHREKNLRGTKFKAGQWNKIQMYYLTPDMRSTKDKIGVFFWNRSKKPIFVDDLLVESFEPKEDKSVFF